MPLALNGCLCLGEPCRVTHVFWELEAIPVNLVRASEV